MLRSFLTWLLILTTTLLVAACCGSVACECNDTYADAIGLQFTPVNPADTAKKFKPTEIATVYLIRIPRDTAQRADTTLITRSQSVVFQQPIIINNTTPFSQSGTRRLDQYKYVVYLAPTRRATPTFQYNIDSIALKTTYQGDGCCTCYQNSMKQVYTRDQLNNRRQFDLTDPAGENQLVSLTLTRLK